MAENSRKPVFLLVVYVPYYYVNDTLHFWIRLYTEPEGFSPYLAQIIKEIGGRAFFVKIPNTMFRW